jgi:hypothetical protein
MSLKKARYSLQWILLVIVLAVVALLAYQYFRPLP